MRIVNLVTTVGDSIHDATDPSATCSDCSRLLQTLVADSIHNDRRDADATKLDSFVASASLM